MKVCKTCSKFKSDDEFYTVGKWQRPSCKACMTAKSLIYQKKNRKARSTYTKKWRLANVYGITQEEYDQLFLKQEGKCAICSKHRDELDRDLCVDHNHTTGKVRGLLCYQCNVTLGYMKDNASYLRKAADYLEAANASSVS